MSKRIITIHSDSYPMNGISSTAFYLDTIYDEFKVINWNPSVKPVFDMFEEMKPDLLITDAELTPNLKSALTEFDTKLIICGKFVPHELEPDLVCFPIDVSNVMLKHIDLPYEVVKPAVNLAKFRHGKQQADKQTDVLFFASTAQPSQDEIDILEILSSLKLRFKIIGHKRPFLQYVGRTDTVETSDFFASSKITIDVNNSSLFDIAAQGGFVISNVANELYPETSSIEEGIEYWLDKDKDRIKIGKSAKKKVVKDDTYFHRMATIFSKLGWDLESKLTIDCIDKII